MKKKELKEILRLHVLWLNGDELGVKADLSGSNLSYSDLRNTNLRNANLRNVNLSGSNLSGCDLSGSNLNYSNLNYSNLSNCDLSNCDLSNCDLSYSNLRYANLSGSDLSGSYLSYSDLSGSNLSGSNLSDSNLSDSNLSDVTGIFKTYPEEGGFICYKQGKHKLTDDYVVITLGVPNKAKRVGAINSTKFRVSEAKVLKIEKLDGTICVKDTVATGSMYTSIEYKVGVIVFPDSFDESDRVECSNGIHVFISKQEAKEF